MFNTFQILKSLFTTHLMIEIPPMAQMESFLTFVPCYVNYLTSNKIYLSTFVLILL